MAILGTTALKRVASHLNFSVPVRVAERRFRVPIVAGAGLRHLRAYEPHVLGALRDLLPRRPGTFVDVGVNLGQTLLSVKALDWQRRYVGFEPNVRCCDYVTRLIHANEIPGCTLLPVGLATATTVTKLFSDGATGAGSSIVAEFRDPSHYASADDVLTLDGDTALERADVKDLAVLKIDVEGGELEVLQGLERTLAAQLPHILCEILPVYDERLEAGRFRRDRQDRLLKLIFGLGYLANRIGAEGRLEPMTDIPTHADLSRCDYLFAPA